MRKPILLLAAVALGTAACSSSGYSASYPAYGGATSAPDHHLATQPPYDPYEPEQPPATPYDGVDLPGPGRQPVRPGRPRPRVHVRASTSTPRRTPSPSATSMDGNLPDPASVRAEEFVNAFDQDYAAPDRRHVRDQQRRRPQPVPRRGRGAPPHRRPGEGDHPPRATGRRAHVRHRHLGLDGPRGPPRPRQAGADLPRRPPPAPRHRRDRRVRHATPRSSSSRRPPRTPTASCRRSTRCSPAARPTPRPASGSATSSRPTPCARAASTA